MTRAISFLFAAVLPCCGAILSIGSSTVPPDVFAYPASATEIYNTGTLTFPFDGDTLTFKEVVISDPTNTFCAGCLDFVLTVDVESGPNSITNIKFGNMGLFLTDIGYVSIEGTLAPSTVSRGSGDYVNFNFSGLSSGVETYALVVETNATTYGLAGISYLTFSSTGNPQLMISDLAIPVPEPSTGVLIALAGAAAAAVRLRTGIVIRETRLTGWGGKAGTQIPHRTARPT